MVNQKQIFFDFRLNFNLFNPDAKRATTNYAVVYFKRKQYRINTGVKVYPSQWNKKRQLAVISPKQTKLDNLNNIIVNDKLKHILLSFEPKSRDYVRKIDERIKAICAIVLEIGKAANDVLFILFFQDNVITLGLNSEYYLPETMSKREIQRLFEMKPYKGTIIA